MCVLSAQVKSEDWGGMFIDLSEQDTVADKSVIKATCTAAVIPQAAIPHPAVIVASPQPVVSP